MASIFISYRRDDAAGHAGRLCDRLTARFGDDRVFMDIQDIRPGQNFAQSIDETIAACDCVLAIIGPRWLESVLARKDQEDFVRRELAAALTRNVTLIPVLVGGARMPAADQLPAELAGVSRHNALEVRDEHFDDDVARLTGFLATTLGGGAAAPSGRSAPRRPVKMVTAAVAAALVAAAIAGTALWVVLRPAQDATHSTLDSKADQAADDPTQAVKALEGAWIAEMQKPGQPAYRIRLEFHGGPGGYAGTVQYPTGDGTIQDVVVDGRAFTFKTLHLPQFDSTPATITYQGSVAGDGLQLIGLDSNGVATGVARRVPPR